MLSEVTKFYEAEDGKLYLGDARHFMSLLSDESVDFILTDPPWMISQEVTIHRASNLKYKGKDISLHFGLWDDQWNDDWEYIAWCREWLAECVRVLKPCCHLVFFFDKKKVSYVWYYLEELGMKGRSPLFWLKTNPVPRGRKVDFMKSLEMALWFTKGAIKQERFNWKLGQQRDYVEASIPQNPRYHPAQKPLEVLGVWIRYLSKEGELILDPFCGSGSTLVAARKTGRRWVGCDIDKDFLEVAKRRIESTAVQLGLAI